VFEGLVTFEGLEEFKVVALDGVVRFEELILFKGKIKLEEVDESVVFVA
jgi:hypothetical protein